MLLYYNISIWFDSTKINVPWNKFIKTASQLLWFGSHHIMPRINKRVCDVSEIIRDRLTEAWTEHEDLVRWWCLETWYKQKNRCQSHLRSLKTPALSFFHFICFLLCRLSDWYWHFTFRLHTGRVRERAALPDATSLPAFWNSSFILFLRELHLTMMFSTHLLNVIEKWPSDCAKNSDSHRLI